MFEMYLQFYCSTEANAVEHIITSSALVSVQFKFLILSMLINLVFYEYLNYYFWLVILLWYIFKQRCF